MQPFFSIIIPVYNSQEYISRCLDSCINQTFSNFEIIIVDDCGQDNSMQIIQKYVQEDKRIQIIKNSQNYGGFYARIFGDNHACGKYILYVDSDDFLEKNALEEIYKKIQEYYRKTGSFIDIVHFDFNFYPKRNETNQYFFTLKEHNQTSLDSNDLLNVYYINHKYLSWNLWDKAYKNDRISVANHFILEHFDQSRKFTSCDDALKLFITILFCKENIKIDKKLYNYAFIQKDKIITMSRIEDARYIVSLLDTLDQTSIALKNPSYVKAKTRIQKQIRQNIETVLYRGMGGGDIIKYINYQIKLLRIDFRWQNIVKILLSLLTFGKLKK